jgi:putative peptidoglycan lipid II flippase
LPASLSTAPDDGRSARNSVVVAAFTSTSRVSGVIRILVVGAVLGPTHLGDAYQVTNTLPNLVWYGFLAGSLVPALLVPVLVQQLELRRPDRVDAVSRGFLGIAALAAAVIAPLAMLGLPLLMQVATLGIPAQISDEQVRLARLLVLLTVPQTFLYGVIGTAAAVMYARRRFALPSLGPTLENVGVIVVLVVVALTYGEATGAPHGAPVGELVLLGAGSTAAVALNAGLQWWGAHRCGVALFPTWGWRDEALRVVLRRTRHSVVSAALLAAQTLLILLLASRVVGGAVALQVAFNFYVLPIALIATPIGLALLPELSHLVPAGQVAPFTETLARGLASALFLAAPAAVGYVLLARPIADVVAAGQMGTPTGRAMISGSLAALALGLVGQTVCFVSTQAAYARGDTVTPLWCMVAQAIGCLVLCGGAVVLWDAASLVRAVAGASAVATLAGGLLLLVGVARQSPGLLGRLGAAGVRIGAGVAVMVLPVHFVSMALQDVWPGRTGSAAALVAGSAVGLAVFLGTQHLLRSPELAWWRTGLSRRRPARDTVEEAVP